MSESVWYRYGLSQDVCATVRFTQRPSADDVGSLLEILDKQIDVLRRANQRATSEADRGD